MDYATIKEKIEVAIKKHFKPEFLNRLNDTVIFHPLDKAGLMQVIELELKKVQKRLLKKEIYISLDDKAKEFLVEKGFQPEMGARPLRRIIEQYLEDPLAENLLMHPGVGRRCQITVEEDHISFIDLEVFPLKRNDTIKESKNAQKASAPKGA